MNPFDLQMNPFKEIGSDWGLVSAGTAGNANIMTVSWGAVGVIWGKNAVFVFVRNSRYTKDFIDKGGTFSLSFFDEKYRQALALCGSKSGRNIDKWAAANLTPAENDGVVYPKEAKRAFLCRKLASIPLDSVSFADSTVMPEWYPTNDFHTMYIGEIIDIVEN